MLELNESVRVARLSTRLLSEKGRMAKYGKGTWMEVAQGRGTQEGP